MGKEQELLEAARTGNVTLVEKLLSGKKGLLGNASGSLPLPSLLSMWRGLNVNCTDSSGYTPLHHASLNGHRDVVLKLLQYEASTNIADNKGCFPLHLAAWKGDVEIVKILIHHGPSLCRVNEQNNENETALHCAAQYGHSEVVAVLLEEHSDPAIRNNKSETPLDLAALYGRLQVVKMLVNGHPNLMSYNTNKHTPLHLAARNGHKAAVQVLLEAGVEVNSQTEKGSALHEAALFGKMDVVRILLETGIDANIIDGQGRTALDILKEHPSQKSQQIAALIQEYMAEKACTKNVEEPVRQCPVPTPRTSVSTPAASPSPKTKHEPVTGELSKLLNEIKMCKDKEFSFEDLCQTISMHSVESFGSGKFSEEELGRNGSLTKSNKRPSPPLIPPSEEEEGERSCGPAGLWEALTPCNGCRNLGFPSISQDTETKKTNNTVERMPSPSLDVFPPEEEDNPYEFLATAVTRKPCSLDISRLSSAKPDNSPHVTITEPELHIHGNNSTGPTPDCSPPSPDTALKNIEKVIRPQPKQRTSLITSLESHRPNHSYDFSEISSSLGYASFSTSPPISPANYSIGSVEDCDLAEDILCQREAPADVELPDGHIPEQFAGLLHGSSPACESPDNPYQLYSKAKRLGGPEIRTSQNSNLLQATDYTAHLPRTGSDASVLKSTKEGKPQVVYRTIFHTKVNQVDSGTFPNARNSRNCEPSTNNTTGGFEDRASTLGRMRSIPKNVLDLQLTRNFSKSDSNLISCSPIEEESRVGRCESAINKPSPGKHLERTPSFTAEWEEIDKIMSSIGAGINTGLEDIKEDVIGPRCPVQSVGQWLDNIGLVQYENHLLANGFDNVQFMGSNVVEDQDLLEIGILNSAHRQRLLQAIRLLPRIRPVGYDGNNPTSVAEWLESLDLGDYTKAFLINGYTSMELVKKIWDIELINVLKISLLGHRKRILASLGDRLHEDPPQKPPRSITLRADARRRRNENYFDDVPRSKLERQMAQVSMAGEWCEPITLRPPNEATSSTPVQYWQHHPEKLIFQSCDYEAYYLGSMLVKELRGTESTQDACAKMRKSTEQMKKVPTIVLSVSYKGVKFIDASNKASQTKKMFILFLNLLDNQDNKVIY
ncbi:ankyrin repeat and sterile alpha motif domain-containing protein 1B isoform X1 [Erpetoichthys calabaricus]|uniref:ankyrin repeat and sterile alpha motif domain-containing protein 1B isoform X1 n=1 Tax=Erpetoichthys calabaricus TaxID=27687 RepID=UPI0022344405|nr:ankyrin repeat and sterile alpha motif domain-containing protein 1B isoform X1 [Erpetoichthys calabaricus]